jgi:putative ABC transport system permease protein
VKVASLFRLVARDLERTRGALATSGFGIAAGTAALIFFLALGLGVRKVLLGEVFPVDQVELEPPKAKDPGFLGLLVGGAEPAGISAREVDALRSDPEVARVFPKLRFAFPASGRGGKEIFGRDVGTSELIGDGIDPALLAGEAKRETPFEDPLRSPGPSCDDDAACAAPAYCERPSGEAKGRCSAPVPVLVSRYLIEIFDKSLAPAHGLPPVGETLVARAEGVTFDLRLGESLLGKARRGAPRTVRARVVGVSKRAIDLGITLPLDVVRRWNREYASDAAADQTSSVIVQVQSGGATAGVIARGARLGLEPKDTRARDVSVLVTSVIGLLSLVAVVILVVSASNIAYTFRVLVSERRAEIALYRAVGAAASDMRRWMLCLAVAVGLAGGAGGILVARVLALVTDQVAGHKLPDFPFKPASFFLFPLWLYAAGIAFGAVFATLGAFGPARRAARVDPASSLSSL